MEGWKRNLDKFPVVDKEEETNEQENKSVEEAATTAHENGKEKVVGYELTSENEEECSEEKVNGLLVRVIRV